MPKHQRVSHSSCKNIARNRRDRVRQNLRMPRGYLPRHKLGELKKKQFANKILGFCFDLFATATILVLLFIAWQVFYTDSQAGIKHNEINNALNWPKLVTTKIAPAQTDESPLIDPVAQGEVIGKMYIPRFGLDYWRLVFEGTRQSELNTMGFGHYTQTALAGERGIFALAAHRNGYGSALKDITNLQAGDAIIFRTNKYWFIYKAVGYRIVDPDEISAISKAPEQIGDSTTDRLIALSTCHPEWSTKYRYIEYGKFSYWAYVKDGIPKELTGAYEVQ